MVYTPPHMVPAHTGADAYAITPSDNVELAVPISYIYVGGAGNITIITAKGATVAFIAVPVGKTLEVGCATFIKSTGTTATNLVGLV